MPDEPLPGEQPLARRASTTARKRPGPIRGDVLESVTRRSEEDARAAEAEAGPAFRAAHVREQGEASDEHRPEDRPIPSPLRPRPAPDPPNPADEEDDRWLQNWQANEIRWLNTKVEELERQLRRYKIVSTGAVGFGGLALVAAVALGIASPQAPESLVADIEAMSTATTPATSAPPTGEVGQGPASAPSQADAMPVPARPDVGERGEVPEPAPSQTDPLPATPEVGDAAGRQPRPDDQNPEALPSPAPTNAASAAGKPGRAGEAQWPPVSSAGAATAPAAVASDQGLEPWQLEAERALTALIEPGTASGEPGTEQDVQVPELLSTLGRLQAEFLDGSTGVAIPYAATAAVNLRDRPNTEAEVLTVVDEGDTVRRLASEGEWLLVEYGDPGEEIVTGWVYGRFMRRIEGAQENGPSARSGG